MAKTKYNDDHERLQNLVRIPDITRERLDAIYSFVGTWRCVSATPSQFANIPPGTLCSVYNGSPVPKRWRRQFGMPPLVQVEACEECGKLHAVDWCVSKFGEPKKPRVNSKPRRKNLMWYKRPENYPGAERWESITKGWTL